MAGSNDSEKSILSAQLVVIWRDLSLVIDYYDMHVPRCFHGSTKIPASLKGCLPVRFCALRLTSWSMCLTHESVEDKLQRIVSGYLLFWLPWVYYIHQNDNRNVQSRTCKQPIKLQKEKKMYQAISRENVWSDATQYLHKNWVCLIFTLT